MTWVTARPSAAARNPHIQVGAAPRKLFSLNNEKGICAGYSQTWLTLSIAQGAPHIQSGSILNNVGQISNIHHGSGVRGRSRHVKLGGASITTLPESGLAIQPGYPVEAAVKSWTAFVTAIPAQGDGYYYMTMRGPFTHAMAAVVVGPTVYYLEPQHGLYAIPSAQIGDWAEDMYGQQHGADANATTYKIYKVGEGV